MKQFVTWQFIHRNLAHRNPVMLLYVLESSGSSPGRRGFFMAVNREGEMEGSIGGGIMEHKLVEKVKYDLKHSIAVPEIRKQIHNKEAPFNQSGMICSGEQTVLLSPLSANDIDAVQQILSCLSGYKNGSLVLSPAGLSFSGDSSDQEADYIFTSPDDWYYKERVGYKNHLYIIGGGHCALALSKMMRGLDFYIHLFDHRADLNTFLLNESAHEKTVVKEYSDLEEMVPSGAHHYVVVMTFGYRTDDLALRALLHKDFRYFGLLGSQKKIEKMFGEYRCEGIPEAVLKKLFAPVGLAIHSQTPEEIAISIAAQLIQVKNERK